MGIIKLTEKPIGSNPSTNTHFVVTQPETVDGITKESVRRLKRNQVIDDTLSTAGMAADAKAVGDELTDLKADLADLQAEIEGGGSGSGLTTLQQEWLITALSGMLVNPSKAEDVENAIQNLEDSFRNQVNSLTLNKNTLSLSGESQEQLVATVDPSTATIIWTTSNASIATVSNGLVTSVGNGSCVITATAGNRSARCAVTVSGIYETYRIINSLTNVASSNQATSIVYGSSYQATLTPNSGYSISSVSVLMGNVDITSSAYADGVISISNVDGEIIITATAVSTIIASNRETVDGKENLKINVYTTTWAFVHGMSTQEQKTSFSGAVIDRVELYFKQIGTYDVIIGAGDVSTFGNSNFSFSNSEVHNITVSEEGFQTIELNDGNGLSIGENQTLAISTSKKSLGYLSCSGTTGIGINGYITVEEANGMIANTPDQWESGKGEFYSAFALYGTIYRK